VAQSPMTNEDPCQIVLSRFTNPNGLTRSGENGSPRHRLRRAADGLRRIMGWALISQTIEQSNVDLGKEFVDMIITRGVSSKLPLITRAMNDIGIGESETVVASASLS